MANGDDLADLRKASARARDGADAELERELTALRRMTGGQLQQLRPRLECDDATFRKLLTACEEATAANISIAEFTSRLKTLGTNVLAVARRASGLLPL